MASARFEQLLAGTAVALALALTPYASSAFAASEARDHGRRAGAGERRPAAAEHQGPLPRPMPRCSRSPRTAPAETRGRASPRQPRPRPPIRCRQLTDGAKFTTAAVRPTPRSSISFATNWPPESSTASLAARRSARPIEAFYSSRDFAPLWIADGAISDRAQGRGGLSRAASMPTASIRANIRCRRSRPA